MNKLVLIIVLFVSAFTFIKCTSTQKLYEKGNFKAVVKTLNYKASKGRLTQDELPVFLNSLNNYIAFKNEVLGEKLASTKFIDWQEGYLSLDDLHEEQIAYHNFPQIDPADIVLVDISDWDQKYADKLYQHHLTAYDHYYQKYLANEDKNELINGYYELEKIAHFDRGEINTDSLMLIIAEAGRRTFNLIFSDESFNMFELRHLEFYIKPSDQTWSTFTEIPDVADYTVNIILKNLDKDDQQNESRQQYTNDVIVDYETTVDANGDEVQTPVIETYEALVSEVSYRFAVEAEVEVTIVWNKTGERVAYDSYTESTYAEEYEAFLMNGDTRAIPPDVFLESGTSGFTTFNYNYSPLIEEVLENISREIENYIERF